MAGFMDMLGKKPEGDSAASYQKTVIREIARKLTELEEQNDQNAAAMDEVRRLQKMILQRMEAMKSDQQSGYQQELPLDYAGMEQVDALAAQVQALAEQLAQIEEKIASGDRKLAEGLQSITDMLAEEKPEEEDNGLEDRIMDHLDTVKLSIEDTVHKENIKCYRNVQGIIEEQGDGKEYDVKGLKKFLKTIIWFQLITIVIIVLQILGLL